MANPITEKFFIESDLVIDGGTTEVLSYYDKANEILKRTHAAMGRSIKIQTTTIASTKYATTNVIYSNTITR